MSFSLVEVAVFGALDLRLDGRTVRLGVTGPTRSLLQYLVCTKGRLTRREHLMEMLWGDTRVERRRSSLNSAIWRIKKALRGVPRLGIDATAECLRLTGADAPGVEVDFILLDRSIRDACACPEEPQRGLEFLIAAVDRCDGIPLDGVDDAWADIERERLTALRMRGQTIAMRQLAALRRYDEAIEMGRRILLSEPYRECAFQEVLCLHVLNGQRARVLPMFDEFAAALRADLGIRPMAETRALRDYLASDRSLAAPRPKRRGGNGDGSIRRPGIGELVEAIESSRDALAHLH